MYPIESSPEIEAVRQVTEAPVSPAYLSAISRLSERLGILAPAVAAGLIEEFNKEIWPKCAVFGKEGENPVSLYSTIPNLVLSAWKSTSGSPEEALDELGFEIGEIRDMARRDLRGYSRLFVRDRRGFELVNHINFNRREIRRRMSLFGTDTNKFLIGERIVSLSAERYRCIYLLVLGANLDSTKA